MTVNPSFPDPNRAERPGDPQRRFWMMTATAAGGIGAVVTAIPFVSSFAPSERVKSAGGPLEVDISDILPGGIKTVEWRGKPVWLVRRTPEMLASLQGHDAELVDPRSTRDQQPSYARNPARAFKPEVFVAIGICTHLGCSPSRAPKDGGNLSHPTNWPFGFFCPCHGSTFDGAGRVFRNKPAPTNLESPPYRYISDTRILVGEDRQA